MPATPPPAYSSEDDEELMHSEVQLGSMGGLGPRLHFQCRRVLGRGSFGYVAEAILKLTDEHELLPEGLASDGDIVALKFAESGADSTSAATAEHDALQLLARVSAGAGDPWPSTVVRLLATGKVDGCLVAALTYASEGDVMDAMIRRQGRPFPTSTVRLWTRELTEALHFVHRHGIIHRDVSLTNALLVNSGHLMLSDFGAALPIECGPAVGVVGAPEFACPEAARGESYGCNADWWAVGVFCFELLVGAPPFWDRDPSRLLNTISTLKAPPEFPPGIPDLPAEFCRSMLTVDLTCRLTGADAVLKHAFLVHK